MVEHTYANRENKSTRTDNQLIGGAAGGSSSHLAERQRNDEGERAEREGACRPGECLFCLRNKMYKLIHRKHVLLLCSYTQTYTHIQRRRRRGRCGRGMRYFHGCDLSFSICLSISPSRYLSLYLSTYICIHLSVCLSVHTLHFLRHQCGIRCWKRRGRSETQS